jgi:ribosomal protein L11 methyltransferase
MVSTNKYNVFRQGDSTFVVEFTVKFAYVEKFSDVFESIADVVSSFEYMESKDVESRPDDIWMVQLYFEHGCNEEKVTQQIGELASDLGVTIGGVNCYYLDDRDWVTEVQQSFPAITIGRYFIHSSFYGGKKPTNKYRLLINPARAFGTGEHETTKGCLLAISCLSKKRNFHNILDMGCGSGILAIAMAKAWKKPVLASDIDQQAVRTTKENALLNQVDQFVSASLADGYKSKLIIESGPYDLITSNILAKPLKKFAHELSANLTNDGVAILSGLLAHQERMVLAAYRAQGLHLIKRIKFNCWHTLVVGRR